MDQKLLAFLHELRGHLTDGKRLKPGISRMRHLAGHGTNAEFDAWFLPLRQRILERYPEGDRLALEWLSRPELFQRHKHECHKQATSRFWLLAAWAGRYPPESGAQAVTAALESCLTSPRGQAYVYEGSGGLVRLVDHLKEQTPPAEHGALGRRFLDILAARSFADRLKTFGVVADAEGYIYYNDLVAQLRHRVGQRLLRAFLPAVMAEGRASDRELAIILQRFDLSDFPLDPPDWAMALARVSNQAADEFLRTRDIEAMAVVMHGRCAGLSAFVRLCQALERTVKLPEWDRNILLEARLLSQLQPPSPGDLDRAQTASRYPACELISGGLLAPAWLQVLEAGLGWSGLAEVAGWALRYPPRLRPDQRLLLWTEDLESQRMPKIVKASGELPKAAREAILAASSLPQVAGEGRIYLRAMAGLEPRRARRLRAPAVFAMALQPGGRTRSSENQRRLLELARQPELGKEARLALRLWGQLQGRDELPELCEEELLRQLRGRQRPSTTEGSDSRA